MGMDDLNLRFIKEAYMLANEPGPLAQDGLNNTHIDFMWNVALTVSVVGEATRRVRCSCGSAPLSPSPSACTVWLLQHAWLGGAVTPHVVCDLTWMGGIGVAWRGSGGQGGQAGAWGVGVPPHACSHLTSRRCRGLLPWACLQDLADLEELLIEDHLELIKKLFQGTFLH